MKLAYLCVTGSAGWGYFNIDKSDVDLRGVYYPGIKEKYLERMPEEMLIKQAPLEVVYWSFDKFWKLLMASNPTTIEWLLSPCLYADPLFRDFQRFASAGHFNRYALAKHYISMARANLYKYTVSQSAKKTRYIMRGIRSANSVIYGGLPIMDLTSVEIPQVSNLPEAFEELIESVIMGVEAQKEEWNNDTNLTIYKNRLLKEESGW